MVVPVLLAGVHHRNILKNGARSIPPARLHTHLLQILVFYINI